MRRHNSSMIGPKLLKWPLPPLRWMDGQRPWNWSEDWGVKRTDDFPPVCPPLLQHPVSSSVCVGRFPLAASKAMRSPVACLPLVKLEPCWRPRSLNGRGATGGWGRAAGSQRSQPSAQPTQTLPIRRKTQSLEGLHPLGDAKCLGNEQTFATRFNPVARLKMETRLEVVGTRLATWGPILVVEIEMGGG